MHPRDRVRAANAVLVDLDGCLLAGDALAPGAAALVAAYGTRLAVVSNNSTLGAEAMAAALARRGVLVAPERILLAGAAAVDHVAATRPGAAVLALAVDAMRDCARRRGLRLVDDGAAVVLLCRDLDLSYARIAAAVRALHAGAALVVANPDLTHPDAQGRPVPETGALAALLTAAVPAATAEIVGKPQPALFRAALRRLGATPEEAVMIGDNPATDGAGAAAAGIAAVIVGRHPQADIGSLAELSP